MKQSSCFRILCVKGMLSALENSEFGWYRDFTVKHLQIEPSHVIDGAAFLFCHPTKREEQTA